MKSIEREKFESETLPHLEALRRTALWLTMHGSRAETLAVETVLQDYPVWHSCGHAVSSKTRLFRIMTRRFFQHGTRHPQSLTSAQEQPVIEIETFNGNGSDPNALFDSRQPGRLAGISHIAFKGAIARLEPQSRLLVLLRWREDFTYAEIAYITDLSEQTVKTMLFRLRQAIRLYLLDDAEWLKKPHVTQKVSSTSSEAKDPTLSRSNSFGQPPFRPQERAGNLAVDTWDNEGGASGNPAIG